MPLWTSMFFCGCASSGQDSPKASLRPKGNFRLKEPHRKAKVYSQMNADWKVEKAQYAEFNVPTCGKIAVWQLCRARQPLWNSHDGPEQKMFGSMPWCWFPWQKLKGLQSFTFVLKPTWFIKATNFTQTPKKKKNEFWNCHLAMLGRVAKPIFTSLCPGQRLRVWVCWGAKSGTAWEPLAISRPSLRGPQPRDVDALACTKEL